MATEIERKFLVDTSKLPSLPAGQIIAQGYLPTEGRTVVRVRRKDQSAFLTIKGENTGLSRLEFEYPIPTDDADALLQQLCQTPVIRKTRYLLPFAEHTWELDIFEGDNQGLVVAEVEMQSEDERVELPEWVTEEVSGEAKYYNSSLQSYPYCQW